MQNKHPLAHLSDKRVIEAQVRSSRTGTLRVSKLKEEMGDQENVMAKHDKRLQRDAWIMSAWMVAGCQCVH